MQKNCDDSDRDFPGSDLWVRGMDFSMEGIDRYENVPGLYRIREEVSHFLLNLNRGNMADSAEKQKHFLFMALLHLDNIDMEVNSSYENEGLTSIEMIHHKIRSLKILIMDHIRHLNASGQEAREITSPGLS